MIPVDFKVQKVNFISLPEMYLILIIEIIIIFYTNIK